MPTLTRSMARFLVALDIESVPEEIAERTRACLLNGLGIGLGCHDTAFAPVAQRAALAMEGGEGPGATMLGDGRRTGIAGAVIANAALLHGRAQEDSCGAAHFGTVLLPLLIALIEARGLGCGRLLPALLAGYECGGLIERDHGQTTVAAGFRSSPLYGGIAAAAAVAKLLDFSEDEAAAALSLAAGFAGGLMQPFADGTDDWRYQVGVAGVQGWQAAELARAGAVAAPRALEGKAGLLRSFARAEVDAEALAARLGTEWSIRRVAFKPYPVCAYAQTPTAAALALRERLQGRVPESVEVFMNPFECGYAGLAEQGPFETLGGTLMSIPFCVSLALQRGVPTLRAMTTFDDAAVNALAQRTALKPDPQVAVLSCRLKARLPGGELLEEEALRTAADYAWFRPQVSELIRRVGAETGLPPVLFDRLEDFVARLPDAGIEEVLACFDALPRRQAA